LFIYYSYLPTLLISFFAQRRSGRSQRQVLILEMGLIQIGLAITHCSRIVIRTVT